MEVVTNGSLMDDEARLKRRASAEDWTVNKKRALSSMADASVTAPVNGSNEGAQKPQTGNDDDVFPDKEKIQAFRKVAIFRRMRHYQAECARERKRADEFEKSLRQSELARMSADSCWSFTLDVIRRLLPKETWSKASEGGFELNFPPRVYTSEDLEKAKPAFEEKLQMAESIITHFVKLTGKVGRPNYNELFSDCDELQKYNTFLAGEVDQALALLRLVEKERDDYVEELRSAQTKIIRLETSSLLASLEEPKLEKAQARAVPQENSARKQQLDGTGNASVRTESPEEPTPDSDQTPDDLAHEISHLRKLVQARNEMIQNLTIKNYELENKLKNQKTEITNLSQHTIKNTRVYALLYDHSQKQAAQIKQVSEEIVALRHELDDLQINQAQVLEEMQAVIAKQVSEAKVAVSKRDEDVNRIRQQRDQLDSQVKELKMVYEAKWSGINKYRDLAESQGKRIEAMSSEIRRLRGRLAAASGDEDLYSFFSKTQDIDSDYVEDLRKRHETSLVELESLRSTIGSTSGDFLDASKLRAELSAVKKLLEAYRSLETSDPYAQLQAKEEQLRATELRAQASAQEVENLYIELNNLSEAWEEAEKALKAEVVTIGKWEDEREKLVQAKARSDNKYYKAMAEIDARDIERKNASDLNQKQAQVLAMRTDLLKETREALTTSQTENKVVHNIFETLERQLNEARLTAQSKEFDLLDHKARYSTLEKEKMQVDIEMLQMKTEVRHAKESLEKAEAEAGRVKERMKDMKRPALPTSKREELLQEEVDKANRLIKCSTCQLNYRTVAILKCMHTFCKPCVDSRIANRERRCPHCNIAFSASDVMAYHMQ